MTIPRRVATAIPAVRSRSTAVDNLKVCLVVGVIVAHVTMAWTGLGTWVFDEPPVREPLLTIATLLAVIGSLFGMALFFLIAGVFTPRSLARKGVGRFLADRAIRLGVPNGVLRGRAESDRRVCRPGECRLGQGLRRVRRSHLVAPGARADVVPRRTPVFSAVYAVTRTLFPPRTTGPTPCAPGTWWPQERLSHSPPTPCGSLFLSGRNAGTSRSGKHPRGSWVSSSAPWAVNAGGSTRSSRPWRATDATSRGARSPGPSPSSGLPARDRSEHRLLRRAAAHGSHW